MIWVNWILLLKHWLGKPEANGNRLNWLKPASDRRFLPRSGPLMCISFMALLLLRPAPLTVRHYRVGQLHNVVICQYDREFTVVISNKYLTVVFHNRPNVVRPWDLRAVLTAFLIDKVSLTEQDYSSRLLKLCLQIPCELFVLCRLVGLLQL